MPTSSCLRAHRPKHKVNLWRKKGCVEPIDSVGSDMRGTIIRVTHHQRSISVNGMFSRGARWKHQPATGSNIADERCERAQRVCRKRGGGRPRKNGRGGGSPAATRRPRHLVPLGARPRPAAQSVMHVSLSKYLRKAAPTPPGLAPFLFAPVKRHGAPKMASMGGDKTMMV